MTNKVYAGYTREELAKAFALIQPEKGWKFPINATIETDDINMVLASIDFYVGGCGDACLLKNGKWKVTAPGYYNLIGA